MQKKSYVYRLARLLGGELVLPYDRLVFSRRSVPVKKLANRLLCRVEGGLKVLRPLSYPLALQLEPTIVCQLDCPYCPRVKATAGMKHGHMEWSNYTRLLEEVGPYLGAIAFWQWGEPLLHPRIADMIKLAHSYGIITFMSTNAQFEPGDVDVPALVASGLDMLIISMDGTRQETYEKFRAGGQIERLKRFARAVIEEKKRAGNKDLIINIRIVPPVKTKPRSKRSGSLPGRLVLISFPLKASASIMMTALTTRACRRTQNCALINTAAGRKRSITGSLRIGAANPGPGLPCVMTGLCCSASATTGWKPGWAMFSPLLLKTSGRARLPKTYANISTATARSISNSASAAAIK